MFYARFLVTMIKSQQTLYSIFYSSWRNATLIFLLNKWPHSIKNYKKRAAANSIFHLFRSSSGKKSQPNLVLPRVTSRQRKMSRPPRLLQRILIWRKSCRRTIMIEFCKYVFLRCFYLWWSISRSWILSLWNSVRHEKYIQRCRNNTTTSSIIIVIIPSSRLIIPRVNIPRDIHLHLQLWINIWCAVVWRSLNTRFQCPIGENGEDSEVRHL